MGGSWLEAISLPFKRLIESVYITWFLALLGEIAVD